MRPALYALSLLALAGCQRPAAPTATSSESAPQAAQPMAVSSSGKPYMGTLSCSGRGCHASLDRGKENTVRYPSRCSYSLVSDNDPHAGAHRILKGELAKNMGRLLGIKDVSRDVRCLACHTTPQAAAETVAGEREPDEWMFGVGCESCHGTAQGWLIKHRDTKDWYLRDGEFKQRDGGLMNLSDPVTRARVCVGCHVGAPADPKNNVPLRDMNHDFIAAGHPRLMFEYGAYLANLPPHWREAHDKQLQEDNDRAKWEQNKKQFEARSWAVGQVVSAEAAMRLLADQARANHGPNAARPWDERPWPEFSAYDCYACHHDIQQKSWRIERGYVKGLAGRYRPAVWYTGLIDLFAPAQRADLDALRAELRQRIPPPARVAELADKVAAALRELAPKVGGKGHDLSGYRAALVARGQALASDEADAEKGERLPADWDAAEQVALGLLPLSRLAGDDAGAKDAMELLKRLAFPRAFNSPQGYRPPRLDQELKDLFGKLK